MIDLQIITKGYDASIELYGNNSFENQGKNLDIIEFDVSNLTKIINN